MVKKNGTKNDVEKLANKKLKPISSIYFKITNPKAVNIFAQTNGNLDLYIQEDMYIAIQESIIFITETTIIKNKQPKNLPTMYSFLERG